MRLSLSTRIFVGFAVVVACFGSASLYGVAAVTSLRHELRFLRKQALPLLDSTRESGVELRAYDEALRRAAPHDLDWVSRFVPNARPYERVKDLIGKLRAIREASRPPRLARFLSPAPVALPALDTSLMALKRSTEARDRIAGDPEMARLLGPAREKATDDAEVFEVLVVGLHRAVAERRLSDAARLVVEIRRMIRQIHGAMASFQREFEELLNQRFARAEHSERQLGLIVAVSSAVSLAVSVVALLVMLATLRPMASLAEVVRRFARGDRRARAETTGASEIRHLAVEWNRMADVLAEREGRLSAQREDLARAERLATLGHMAARMAHEVRNPLSSIGLNAELLEEELRAGHELNRDEARDLLEAIGSEVERLRQVTETYLTRARRVPLNREPTDLGQLIGRLVDFARSELEQRQVVANVQSPKVASASIDTRMVRQALWNLVRNGWEAMPGGGRLWLEVERRATESPDGVVDWLVIVVEDSGAGIAEEARPRLFEPFFTTKEAGTGVGLALVAEVASAHGGKIEVAEPRHGDGACFQLWLPVVPPPEPEAEA